MWAEFGKPWRSSRTPELGTVGVLPPPDFQGPGKRQGAAPRECPLCEGCWPRLWSLVEGHGKFVVTQKMGSQDNKAPPLCNLPVILTDSIQHGIKIQSHKASIPGIRQRERREQRLGGAERSDSPVSIYTRYTAWHMLKHSTQHPIILLSKWRKSCPKNARGDTKNLSVLPNMSILT